MIARRWLGAALGVVLAAFMVTAAPSGPFVLTARVETTPVESRGDAADDSAIWFNRASPGESRVLATDKLRGLEVYDLHGRNVQSLPLGRLNNVDLRQDVPMRGGYMDLAVATHRDELGLAVFEIQDSGQVRFLGLARTGLEEIYGVCLYRYGEQLHVFSNGKDGRYMQHRLAVSDSGPEVTLLREFRLDSQPEGCVVDDPSGRLFMGEESVGVWVMAASPDAALDRDLVIRAEAPLAADIEGLALHGSEFLLVSSQGNHRFAVLEAAPPYRLRGIFRIDHDPVAGIGHVRDTDGVAVSAHDFGPGFRQGLVVVQDGDNAPRNQNFKYLAWAQIAEVLGLDDAIGQARRR
ncbi:phytase [Halomonas sp. 3H]|uniref:phytase n=1 Tax=Halomonas sp. 3H TaxID=2952527 RepID=UPI0020B83EE9|nr:phytase [Halomonas sp. 3H]